MDATKTTLTALQSYFKEDINSFELNTLADWKGKKLPEKALIRVKEEGRVVLKDVGGQTLLSVDPTPGRHIYQLELE